MSFLVSLLKPLAYISVPVLILRSTSPLARYYVNVGIYIGSLVVVSAWGAVVGITMLAAGRPVDLNYYVARNFYAVAGALLGIKIEVEGEEHLETRPALLLGNHQSMLDILILGRVFPRKSTIMAKKELKWTPLGPFMALAGSLFVDRGNSSSAIRSLGEAGETMKRRGTSLWIFPEGTRSSSERSTMLPFKKGGFHLAVQANIPVIPIVTENYWRLYHPGVFTSGTIKVRVLPPIPTADIASADVPSFAVHVRGVMLEALQGMCVDESSALEDSSFPTPPPLSEPIPPTTVIAPPAMPSVSVAIPTPVKPEEEIDTSAVRPDHDQHETLSESGSSFRKTDGSENGTETEEDEGMVLVGHPVVKL